MTHPTEHNTCGTCGGQRPRDVDAWDEYLVDDGGYCPGHLATDDDGHVVGCGAWEARAYELQDYDAETTEVVRYGTFGPVVWDTATGETRMMTSYDEDLPCGDDLTQEEEATIDGDSSM